MSDSGPAGPFDRLAIDVMRLKKIEQAATALVEKLDEMLCSDAYFAVFTIAEIHGCKYAGPDFGEELTALSVALGRKELTL